MERHTSYVFNYISMQRDGSIGTLGSPRDSFRRVLRFVWNKIDYKSDISFSILSLEAFAGIPTGMVRLAVYVSVPWVI